MDEAEVRLQHSLTYVNTITNQYINAQNENAPDKPLPVGAFAGVRFCVGHC